MTATRTFRMTRQRRVILDLVGSAETHPTAEEVFARARRRLPKISLGTVYRSLELLSQSNMIHTLDLTSGPKRFDGRMESHYHLRCLKCGKIDDLPVDPLSEIEQMARRHSGYEIVGHEVEVIGVCPDCKARKPKS